MSKATSEITLLLLREAIEASWGKDTAYLETYEEGNPALGNCYPTSRVIQYFFPKMEIAQDKVWTGKQEESHFWNVLKDGDIEYQFDLTWQQFPHGSVVKEYVIRDRNTLGDSEPTLQRVEILLGRVKKHLGIAN